MAARSTQLILPILIIIVGIAVAIVALLSMLREEEGFGPLYVPNGAGALRIVQDDDPGTRIAYEVGAEFPAYRFLGDVSRHHEAMGWREDAGLLYLTIEDSLDSGWDDYIDATARPQVRRREMMLEFGSPTGERALYLLSYETPPTVDDPPILLRVNASYYNPEEVTDMQARYGLVDPMTLRATPLKPVEPNQPSP